MKPGELKRLKFLVDRLLQKSKRASDKSQRLYEKAGHSTDPSATGDEGWVKVFRLSGEANGLQEAACLLNDLLAKFKIDPETK